MQERKYGPLSEGKPTRRDGSVSRLSVAEIDPGRVKTPKGRSRRGILFYRRRSLEAGYARNCGLRGCYLMQPKSTLRPETTIRKMAREFDATLSDMLSAWRQLKTTWTMLRIFYEPFEPVTRKSV